MELKDRVNAVLAHGQFVKGPEVAEFEQAMAAYVGTSYAIGCNSGTDALILALKAAGIGPGDWVIVPAFTFQATANAVKWVGATPVFVDVREEDFNIDPAAVEKALEWGAQAVIAVNMFGIPAPYTALKDIIIQADFDCVLIEDAAQSMGSRLNRVKSGNLADYGCTSFHPSKPLPAAGDGGMVFTNDLIAAKRIMSYHDHGRQNMTGFGNYWAGNVGMNSRLDTIQAAVLLSRLETFAAEVYYREKQAEAYLRYFSEVPGCRLVEPVVGRVVNYSWFPVLFDDEQLREDALATYGPHGARVIYPYPLHKMGAFVESDTSRRPMPIAESVCRRVLAFPVVHHWETNRCLCELLPDKFECKEI